MGSWIGVVCSFFTRTIIISIFLISITSAPSIPAEVSLSWDENDPPIDGYLLFMRTDNCAYDYTCPTWSGVDTTCTIDELSNGTYYFVVRAYSGDAESGDSNEVEAVICDLTANTSIDDCDVDGLDLVGFIDGDADVELDVFVANFGSLACE